MNLLELSLKNATAQLDQTDKFTMEFDKLKKYVLTYRESKI